MLYIPQNYIGKELEFETVLKDLSSLGAEKHEYLEVAFHENRMFPKTVKKSKTFFIKSRNRQLAVVSEALVQFLNANQKLLQTEMGLTTLYHLKSRFVKNTQMTDALQKIITRIKPPTINDNLRATAELRESARNIEKKAHQEADTIIARANQRAATIAIEIGNMLQHNIVIPEPSSLGATLRTNKKIDVSFVCCDGNVEAHSVVLETCKNSFFEVFLKREGDKIKVISLSEKNTKKEIALFMDFIYEVPLGELSVYELTETLILADMYQTSKVFKACKQSLIHLFTKNRATLIESYLYLYKRNHSIEPVSEKIHEFIVEQFIWKRNFPVDIAKINELITFIKLDSDSIKPDSDSTWALGGNAWAQVALAHCYQYGLGVQKSDIDSFNWYSLAAEFQNPLALVSLNCCYNAGRGVVKNEQVANGLLIKAVCLGSSLAQALLAVHNLSQNIEINESVELLELSTKKENHVGLLNLGLAYYQGRYGLVQDKDKGLELIEKSVAKGSLIGKIVLGELYSYNAKSFQLFREAAEEGHEDGFANLGICYFKGIAGVVKNRVEAFNNLSKSAKDGSIVGLYYLAKCYQRGLARGGVNRSHLQYISYLLVAAHNKCPLAIKELRELKYPLPPDLEATFTFYDMEF